LESQSPPALQTTTPKWHLIYYALAGFDLVAIGISLFINLQITNLYIDSVETNKSWAQRLSQYSKLTKLAIEVNRPGNDIFLTANVAEEKNKLDIALDRFEAHLAVVQISNKTLEQDNAEIIGQHLSSIISHVNHVKAFGYKILSLFSDNPLLAGNEMARMDQSFFNLTESIAHLRKDVQKIQTETLARQSEYAQSLDRYEKAIGFFILVMVMLVAIYGHFLSKKVAAFIAAQSAASLKIKELNETLEARVLRRTEELQISNQELEQFAYIASHDLREPLRKIQTFGDRLLENDSDRLSDDGKYYIDRMLNASMRLKALIEGLLAYSRLGGHRTAHSEVNLEELVKDVVSDLETSIDESKATIEVEALPVLRTDRLLITQVFQNLIANALKFVKKGERPNVRIFAENEGGIYCIKVADKGIGIDAIYKDKIFDVFQRLHGRTEYDGTGVGLSICKKAVEQLQGSLTFRSQLDEGTTFEVRLRAIDPA